MSPTVEGQVCKLLDPLADEDPSDVYLVVEDPRPFDEEDNIYVVNLKDLQRNIRQPLLTPQVGILKNELYVVADTLDEYIRSMNG